MHQILHVQRPYIEQLDPAADPLAQVRPVQLEEGVVFRHAPNHFIGDSRPFPQPRQLELLHFPLPAHVVHQKVGVPFSSYESHDYLLRAGHYVQLRRSVWAVHYTVNGTMQKMGQSCANRLMPTRKSPKLRKRCKYGACRQRRAARASKILSHLFRCWMAARGSPEGERTCRGSWYTNW